MQCLFCGKELALLKRLRGGGEFCSEAHRKDYQEQYEQLALARLLQAKPSGEPAAPLGQPYAAAPVVPEPVPEDPHDELPVPRRRAPQIPARTPAAMIEAPVTSRPKEEAGPAPMAGFVSEPLVPAVTTFQHASTLEMERVMTPSLPSAAATAASGGGAEESLPPAPRVEFGPSLQALDYHTRNNERGMELRDFAGTTPRMDLHLRPAAGTEPAGAADVMEILMSPRPPQKATPWLEAPRGFPAATAELGQLARLDFTTVGFAYSDGPVSAGPTQMSAAPQAAVLTPEPPRAIPVHRAEETIAPAAPPPAAEVEPPALVTQALPVTLHGLAAPRGKWTPAFTSAIAAASDVQIPLSASLPLRPVIVFGPAPAPSAPAPAPAVVATPAQPKSVAPKPAPEPKPVPEKTESQLKSAMVPTPKAVPAKRPVVPETNAPKVSAPATPAAEPRPVEPRKESPTPQPSRAAVAPSEAELPTLHLETKESGWSKLSGGVKVAVAAAVIAALGGVGYLVTRGNGKTAEAPAAAPVAETVASGVPISGGWIDDWANAARSRRHISLLSGSAKLSDYRMEFQAQIESKAIGWIFRGLNPRNYYVAKLETITPGLEPTIALVHFAVVDGQDENRVVVPLPMKVRVDTTYKIRFEAIGNRFAAWVQGQKIAEWTDSRFGSGGVGFFSERDEKAAMQGAVNVVALVPKN
jgi:hypothetical protein